MSSTTKQEIKELRFHICTWNVGSCDPLSQNEIIKMLEMNEENKTDVYVIGLQEIQSGAKETAKSFFRYDEWAETLTDVLVGRGFYMVESVRLQGMSLSVFAKLSLLPFMRFVRTSYERTGFGGNWGNKGGVSVSMWMLGERICFLNTHLPPHLRNKDVRISSFKQIVEGIDFGETAHVMAHDATFWLGDTNFRIDDITRDDVIQFVNKNSFTKLLENDQLIKHKSEDENLSGFVEPQITFPPTYKFDVGTDIYDTSEKQRKPAWTDRILLRINPDTLHMLGMDNDVCGVVNSDDTSYIEHISGTYKHHPYIKTSDHRPVTSQYTLKVQKQHRPLVEVEVMGRWRSEKSGTVRLTLHPGMHKDDEDYLALYKEPLRDFRSYLTWVYVPQNDDPDRVTVTKQLNVEFPDYEVSDTTPQSFRIGYYSNNMLCLLGISDAFSMSQ